VKRRPSAEADQAARRRSERDLARAREAVAEAERRDEKARAELEAIDKRLTELAALREQLTDELDQLEARVAEVTRDAAAADHEARALRQGRDRAGRAVAEAQRHLARARDTLSPDEERGRSTILGG
jgi:chromosome segregation ATPase